MSDQPDPSGPDPSSQDQTAQNVCDCGGAGVIGEELCPTCGGTGRVAEIVGDA